MAAVTPLRLLFVGSAALLALAAWRRDALPPPGALDAAVREDPVQQETAATPFRTTAGGVEYTVRPVFTYDLSGVVVSKHDADTWWDWIHKAWRDELNVTDLCVIWGANARSANYRELEYWSGQFECNARTGSTEVWRGFDMTALSNNHLLTDTTRRSPGPSSRCASATRCTSAAIWPNTRTTTASISSAGRARGAPTPATARARRST